MKAKDWKKWAKCAGIRAIKTVAQTAIATIGTVTVLGQIDTKLVIFHIHAGREYYHC